MSTATAHVWRLDDHFAREHAERLLHLLSPDERARALRYRYNVDRVRFTARRGMLRTIVGATLQCAAERIAFDVEEHGRPVIRWPDGSNLSISVAQAEGLALLACARNCRIGIDAERVVVRSELHAMARAVFSPIELTSFEYERRALQPLRFYEIWTRKEALLKALGQGLGGDPGALTTYGAPTPAGWTIVDFEPSEGIIGAVAASTDSITLVWHDDAAVAVPQASA